jgi:hypothetical protein
MNVRSAKGLVQSKADIFYSCLLRPPPFIGSVFFGICHWRWRGKNCSAARRCEQPSRQRSSVFSIPSTTFEKRPQVTQRAPKFDEVFSGSVGPPVALDEFPSVNLGPAAYRQVLFPLSVPQGTTKPYILVGNFRFFCSPAPNNHDYGSVSMNPGTHLYDLPAEFSSHPFGCTFSQFVDRL